MELSKHTKTRFQVLKRQLHRYGKSPDAETLHKIRVEIKKIKAILKLAESCIKKFKAHTYFVPLRLIFQKAGRIREPELIYGLLMRYEIDRIPDSLIPQSLVEESLSKDFQERIPSFIGIVDEQEKKIEKYLDKIQNHHVGSYVKKKKEKFRVLLFSKWNRGTLHKARKVAKEIIYISAITKKTKKDLDPFYNKIQDVIGQWHDKQLLMSLVKAKNSPDLERLKQVSHAELSGIKKRVFNFNGMRQ